MPVSPASCERYHGLRGWGWAGHSCPTFGRLRPRTYTLTHSTHKQEDAAALLFACLNPSSLKPRIKDHTPVTLSVGPARISPMQAVTDFWVALY